MPVVPERRRECHRRGAHIWADDHYTYLGSYKDLGGAQFATEYFANRDVFCYNCGVIRREGHDDLKTPPPNIGGQMAGAFAVSAVFAVPTAALLISGNPAGFLFLIPAVVAFLTGFCLIFALAAGIE